MPARIALLHILHMAAEGSRAAVANRFEGLSLMGAEYVPPLREELFFVSAEDIGHFGPMFVSSLRWNVVRGPDQIERAQHFQRTFGGTYGAIGDVQIARRGFQVARGPAGL